MAFRTDITNPSVIAYNKAITVVASSKRHLSTQRPGLVAPQVDAFVVLALMQHLATVLSILDAQAAVGGLVPVARLFINDNTYDPVAEYNALRALMVTARDALRAVVPVDGQGRFIYQTADANGNLTNIQLTAADLQSAVTAIDNVVSSIVVFSISP